MRWALIVLQLVSSVIAIKPSGSTSAISRASKPSKIQRDQPSPPLSTLNGKCTQVAESCEANCDFLGMIEFCSTTCSQTTTGLCTQAIHVETAIVTNTPTTPSPTPSPAPSPTPSPTPTPSGTCSQVAESCEADCGFLGMIEVCSTTCSQITTGLCTPAIQVKTDIVTMAAMSPSPTPTPSGTCTQVAESCEADCGFLGMIEVCSTTCSHITTGLCTPAIHIETDIVTITPTPTPMVPICENMADPDNAIPDYCYCTQGSSTTKVAPAKGPNPCPWTTLPIIDGKPGGIFTAPPETNTDMFSFTQGYQIFGCTSSVVSMEDNVAVTSCAGKTYTMGYAPHATVQVGSSTQNVGTMSSSVLYSAISSALESVCPPPPSGSSGACTADVTLTGISYPYQTNVEEMKRAPVFEKRELVVETRELNTTSKELAIRNPGLAINERAGVPGGVEVKVTVIQTDGTLVIGVPLSSYTTSGIRDAMIVLAAGMFAASASGGTCASYSNRQYDGIGKRDLDPRQISYGSTTLCSSTEFIVVEYMNQDINPDNPAAFLGVQLSFQESMADVLQEMFDCEEEVNGAIDIVGAFFPELAPLLLDSEELITFGCEIAIKALSSYS